MVKPALPIGRAGVLAFVIACGGSTARNSSACPDCFGGTLTWGSTGGQAPFHDISSLRSCRDYGRSRTAGNEGLAQLCTTTLDACGSSAVDIGDVQAALADRGVIAALDGSTKTYGGECNGTFARAERAAQTFVPPTVIELILMVGQPTPTGTL